MGLLGHVDRAHAPFADLLQQLVGSDLRAGAFEDRHVERDRGRRFGRGLLEKAACACVEPQQMLHLHAQFRLPGAGFVQVSQALGQVFLLQCGDEDFALGHGDLLHKGELIVQCGIRPRIAQFFVAVKFTTEALRLHGEGLLILKR